MLDKPQLPLITITNKKSLVPTMFIFKDKMVIKYGDHLKKKEPIDSIEYKENYNGDMAHVTEPIKEIW